MGKRIVVFCEERNPRLLNVVASGLRSHGIEIWTKEDIFPGDDWTRVIPREIIAARAAVILGEVKGSDHYLREEIAILEKRQIPTKIFPQGDVEEILAWIAQECPHRK